jgi:hypothetical protein
LTLTNGIPRPFRRAVPNDGHATDISTIVRAIQRVLNACIYDYNVSIVRPHT